MKSHMGVKYGILGGYAAKRFDFGFISHKVFLFSGIPFLRNSIV